MSAFSAWSRWIGWNEWNEARNSHSRHSSIRLDKTARRVRAENGVLIVVASAHLAVIGPHKGIESRVEETIADFAVMDDADAIDSVVVALRGVKAQARHAEHRTKIKAQTAALTVALRSSHQPREHWWAGSMRPVMAGFCVSRKTATCQNRPTRSFRRRWCARINCAAETSSKLGMDVTPVVGPSQSKLSA